MHIDAAGIIVRDEKGKILVLHRKSFVPEGNRWGLPGGGKKDGSDFLETAKLKTHNEVNLDFKDGELKHLGEFKFIDGEGNDVTYNAWIACLAKTNFDIKLNLEGHDYYKWEDPKILVKQEDLMAGMYPILRKYNKVSSETP